MSYVNVFLGPDFISVISDGKVTASNGSTEDNRFKKFIVTNSKVVVAATGSHGLALVLFEIIKKQYNESTYDQINDFILKTFQENKGLTNVENNLIDMQIIVAGLGNNGSIAKAYQFLQSEGKFDELNYKSNAVISMNPPDLESTFDYLYQNVNYIVNSKFSVNMVKKRQKLVLSKVANKSDSVNSVVFQEVIR
ncbi:hypothetical protein EFE27_01220 [Leuconostoc citreum]|uniref:hypothetical protein n=1 Tax=Leuconostoc citreum TaxID=33964 RepID=UPI00218217C7|nr:hypothetical protein [Leuconostoc citreum]MCS8594613.1 hypothetical protein [Leuconostoc citreum]